MSLDAARINVVDTHVHLRDPEVFPSEERAYTGFGAEAVLSDLER